MVDEHANQERATARGGYAHRQIVELVQNGADQLTDAGGRIRILLTPTHLYVADNGRPPDPDLAEYVHFTPNVPEFLRTAKAMELTSEDFEVLIEEVKRRRPSEAATSEKSQARGRLR